MHRMNYLLMTSLLLLASSTAAAEWGDLTLQFVYDGKAPPPIKARVDKDVAYCGKFNVMDRTVLVDADGGVANILTFLYVSKTGKKPTVHPSYAKTANDEIKLDNGKCRFAPYFTILRTTQTLLVTNSDTVGHNTKIDAISDGNQSRNPALPAGGQVKMTFPVKERFPMNVACGSHPWMRGMVVVKEHPYVAVTGTNGKLTIKNIPVGTWTFQFWHERPGYVREVTIGGKKTEWVRGRTELTIKKGSNDLGIIKLAPSVFEEKEF